MGPVNLKNLPTLNPLNPLNLLNLLNLHAEGVSNEPSRRRHVLPPLSLPFLPWYNE